MFLHVLLGVEPIGGEKKESHEKENQGDWNNFEWFCHDFEHLIKISFCVNFHEYHFCLYKTRTFYNNFPHYEQIESGVRTVSNFITSFLSTLTNVKNDTVWNVFVGFLF